MVCNNEMHLLQKKIDWIELVFFILKQWTWFHFLRHLSFGLFIYFILFVDRDSNNRKHWKHCSKKPAIIALKHKYVLNIESNRRHFLHNQCFDFRWMSPNCANKKTVLVFYLLFCFVLFPNFSVLLLFQWFFFVFDTQKL